MNINNANDLTGKRIVVLGGTSGIGLSTALAVAAEGAEVIIASSSSYRVDEALKQLPEDSQGFTADLNDEQQVAQLFKHIGMFDHLVFTAGDSLQFFELPTLDLQEAKQSVNLRLWGSLMAVKYGAPLIRQGGSITLTTGAIGRKPGKGMAVVAAMASAMEGLTRALAFELAPIRVNAVCSGTVRTALLNDLSETERESFFRQVGSRLLTGRVGEPRELAEAYLYLMRGSFTTGQIIVVDGGSLLV